QHDEPEVHLPQQVRRLAGTGQLGQDEVLDHDHHHQGQPDTAQALGQAARGTHRRLILLPPRRYGVAMSATTPKWSLANVPVTARSHTTLADSTRPAPSSRRQPTKT